MTFYNQGAFEYSKIIRNLIEHRDSINFNIVYEIKNTDLLQTLIKFAIMPSPINGFVSLSVDVLKTVVLIAEADKELFFSDIVSTKDPLTHKSLLDIAKENNSLNSMPLMQFTDSKQEENYLSLFKALDILYQS